MLEPVALAPEPRFSHAFAGWVEIEWWVLQPGPVDEGLADPKGADTPKRQCAQRHRRR
jgi:hypothetical protein